MDQIKNARTRIGAGYLANLMSSDALDRDVITEQDLRVARELLHDKKFRVEGRRGMRYLPFLDSTMRVASARSHLLGMIKIAKDINNEKKKDFVVNSPPLLPQVDARIPLTVGPTRATTGPLTVGLEVGFGGLSLGPREASVVQQKQGPGLSERMENMTL